MYTRFTLLKHILFKYLHRLHNIHFCKFFILKIIHVIDLIIL